MIELSKIPKKERTLINVQCDKFFLTINKYKDANPVFNTLKTSIGLPSRYDKEIWCIITCVGKCLRSGNNGSQLTLKSSNYTTANELHNLGISNKRMRIVVDKLDELGWLVFYKGFKDIKNPDNTMRSCLIFSDKLKALFSVSLIARYSRPVTPAEMVEVKDSKTKEPFMKLTKFKGVSSHRDFMREYNGILHRSKITLADVTCAVTYKQVFSDNLESGGRFYTFGGFQTANSSLRPLLKINDNDVTEIDIRGIHPAICRILQGCKKLPESFDPYGVVTEIDIPKQELRSLCKMALMCMINCKSKRGASTALLNILLADRDQKVFNMDFPNTQNLVLKDLTELICKLEKHNNPVKFFGKQQASWQELQRYDSKLSECVMRRFISRGLALLCWHDSWVCEVQHRQLLIDSIKESWFEVFATTDNCYLKIEF